MNDHKQGNLPSPPRLDSGRGVGYAVRVTLLLIGLVVVFVVVSAVIDWSGGIGLVLMFPLFALAVLHIGVGLYSVTAVLIEGVRPGNVWVLIYYLMIGLFILCYVAWTQDWLGAASTKVDRIQDPHTYALSDAVQRYPLDLNAAIQALEAGANPEGSGRTSVVPLRRAARMGEAVLVRKLLESGADVDASNQNGATALHEAAGGIPQGSARTSPASAAVVEELLAAGADSNARSQEGWTPLLAACAAGSQHIAQILVDAGAEVQALAQNGRGCFTLAFMAGHDEILQWTLTQSALPSDLSTALTLAFDIPDVQSFRQFLALGASVDGLASARYPLMKFLQFERPEDSVLFEVLLEQGATGVVPVDSQHEWLIQLTRREPQALERLLRLGVNVDATTSDGSTVLHVLARDRSRLQRAPGVSTLIAAGASIDTRDANGRTPLMEAVGLGYAENVRWLLENGADASLQDHAGRTVWELAVGGLHASAVQALADAELTLPEQVVQFALLNAAVSDSKVVAALLAAGFMPDTSLSSGESSVHAAVRAGSARSLQLLLNAGAPPDRFDTNGYSLVTLAAATGADRVLNWLLNNGFDAEAVDQRGRSPMNAAIRERQLASVRMLLEAGVVPSTGQRAWIRGLLDRSSRSYEKSADHEAIRVLLDLASS